ncbi:MAG: ABC transporter ATP-binding protein [Candidatus Micrarchaeaceae archaeon]
MLPILEVMNLKKYFKIKKGFIKAVDGVDFTVNKGEIFGLVGESGSGKTTIGNLILGTYIPTSGSIIYKGKNLVDYGANRPKEIRREIQMVFQNPASSLNPRKTIKQTLQVPIAVHRPGIDAEELIVKLMDIVDLPTEFLNRFPDELGGGEKQLVAIARALAVEPSLMVLDEPTSALDVSVQGKIINTLMKLRDKNNLTYIFITHNLSLMSNVSNKVAIMYLGKFKEIAETKEFFKNPLHPYTKLLLSSIPVLTEEEEKIKPQKIPNIGEISGALNIPSGCSFHPRCPFVMDVCKTVDPPIIEYSPGHYISCHLYSSEKFGGNRGG